MIDPQTGLVDWHVDLFYDGQWSEITEDVNVTDTLTIKRGRSDYESDMPPTQLSLSLDNTSGRYSPKNPNSPLYGKIGRNQPIRVRVGTPEPYWGFRGGSWLSAEDPDSDLGPDTAGFSVSVELAPDDWAPDVRQDIAAKGTSNWDTVSWFLRLGTDRKVIFGAYDVANNQVRQFSTAAVPDGVHSRAVRFEYYPSGREDFADSVGHPTALTFHANKIGDPWEFEAATWWGDEAPLPLRQTSGPVGIGAMADGGTIFDDTPFAGEISRLLLALPGGVTLADVAPGVDGVTSDTTGRTWVTNGDPRIGDRSARFTGEVRAWPPRWGQPDGSDAEVPVEAYGVRRRLDRTSDPVRSPFYRASTNPGPASRTVAYWPMEDDEDSSQFASSIGGFSMLFGNIPGYHVRDIDLAADGGFLGSDALPEFHITAATGRVESAPPTGELRVYGLFRFPDEGTTFDSDVVVLSVATTGSAAIWHVDYLANSREDGAFRIRCGDSLGNEIVNNVIARPPLGVPLLFGLWLRESGNTIQWQVFSREEGATTFSVVGGSVSGYTVGSATDVTIGRRGNLQGTTAGHITVRNRDTNDASTLWSYIINAFNGNVPETATERVRRLADEEALPIIVSTGDYDSEELGPQQSGALLDLFDEAVSADMGLFIDSRETRAMQYHPRTSLYNRVPVILDYEAGQVISPFEPTDDDDTLQNDVTVSRDGGSSYRSVLEEGALSVADPPEGVGRYASSESFNLASDVQLPNQATWRLHLGTIDEVRYPVLAVSLNGSPEVIDRLLPVDVGDRITVVNLPKWLPPNTADVIVQGYTEESDGLEWTLTFNCTPASAWSVGVADDSTYGRADTAGSEVLYDVDADATELPVVTTDGPRWVQDSDELGDDTFPYDVTVGGEIVTVTGARSLLSDDFTTTWGTNPAGLTWQTSGTADLTTGPGVIVLSPGAAGMALLPPNVRDVEATVLVSVDQMAAGGWIVPAMRIRQDGDTYLSVNLELKHTGIYGIAVYEVLDGAVTQLGGAELGSYTAGHQYRLRISAIGDLVQARVWDTDDYEYTHWQVSTFGTTITDAGQVGLAATAEATNTNTDPTVTFAQFAIPNPQQFDVTRSTNGIHKPQTAGTAVRLAQPLVLAL